MGFLSYCNIFLFNNFGVGSVGGQASIMDTKDRDGSELGLLGLSILIISSTILVTRIVGIMI